MGWGSCQLVGGAAQSARPKISSVRAKAALAGSNDALDK